MQNLPLEVRLKIALENCSKGKAGVVYSMTRYGEWGRTELLFASGADNVFYSNATFKKISDKSYFDDGLPVRDLQYNLQHQQK